MQHSSPTSTHACKRSEKDRSHAKWSLCVQWTASRKPKSTSNANIDQRNFVAHEEAEELMTNIQNVTRKAKVLFPRSEAGCHMESPAKVPVMLATTQAGKA